MTAATASGDDSILVSVSGSDTRDWPYATAAAAEPALPRTGGLLPAAEEPLFRADLTWPVAFPPTATRGTVQYVFGYFSHFDLVVASCTNVSGGPADGT